MTEQQKLMRKIQHCGFACFEAALFLDTHNTDKDALQYYKKHQQMLADYTKEYEDKYGPLTLSGFSNEKVWDWADGPWPWEAKCDCNAK